MENFLTPLSFEHRREPLVTKVVADAERMYKHARYVLVLDSAGNVRERRLNTSRDSNVLDCLVVFAPVLYKGVLIKRSVVLEIGLRRFVPYAQTEYRENSSTYRGPSRRESRPDGVKAPATKVRVIPLRIPVARLSKNAVFDRLPDITTGLQECVDWIVQGWTNSLGTDIAWVRMGNSRRTYGWQSYEREPLLTVRFPKEEDVLCATASFADMEWRKQPGKQLATFVETLRAMLKRLLAPNRRHGKDEEGNFDDDFVRASTQCHWVADRLKKWVAKRHTEQTRAALFDLIGLHDSTARKLVEQIWRVYDVSLPPPEQSLRAYEESYGNMKDLLLERWNIRNYRSLRSEKKKKEKAEEYTEKHIRRREYIPHAQESLQFCVFASKAAQDKMLEAYCATHQSRQEPALHRVETAETTHRIPFIPSANDDDDIPWDRAPVHTGTNDDIPF